MSFSPKKYQASEDEHRKAFQVFFETRNYAACERATGVSYQTIFSWAKKGYRCPWGCPWHGWDELIALRAKAMDTKAELMLKGVYDPVKHETAITEIIKEQPKNRKAIVRSILRSDVERLSHWEFLYAKVYFDVTGVQLDPICPADVELDQEWMEAYSKKLKEGLRATGLDSGIRLLSMIQKQIDDIRQREGVLEPENPVQAAKEAEKLEQEENEQLSIATLRKMMKEVRHTSPEKLQLMMEQIKADETALNAAQS